MYSFKIKFWFKRGKSKYHDLSLLSIYRMREIQENRLKMVKLLVVVEPLFFHNNEMRNWELIFELQF